MAAIIVVNRWTGSTAGPTKTNITSSTNRMSWSDSPTDGITNPIPIPASGTNLSWWVSTRLAVNATGPATAINNIKWFSDGVSFGTGLTCVGHNVAATNNASAATNASYQIAVNSGGTGIAGVNGLVLNNTNYSGVGTPVDVTTFTSTSTLALAGSLGAGIVNTDFGDFMVYQLQVGSTTNPGVMTARTFTYSYDES